MTRTSRRACTKSSSEVAAPRCWPRCWRWRRSRAALGGRARPAGDRQARPGRAVGRLLPGRHVLDRGGGVVPRHRQRRDDRPRAGRHDRQPRRRLQRADLGGRQRHRAGQADRQRPLQPGTYRLVATTPGTNPVEVPVAVGEAAQTPDGSRRRRAGAGRRANGTAPAQLPRGPAQLPTLSSRGLSTGEADRPFVSVGPPAPRAISPRFGLANILPDGATVPGAPASGTVAWMAPRARRRRGRQPLGVPLGDDRAQPGRLRLGRGRPGRRGQPGGRAAAARRS